MTVVYETVEEMFRAREVPVENQAQLRRTIQLVRGILLEDLGTYVRVDRAAGGEPLRIYADHTDGFASRAEAERASAGETGVWRSATTDGWGADHPVTGRPKAATRRPPGQGVTRKGTGTPARPAAKAEAPAAKKEICMTCFTAKTVTGSCLCE